MKALIVDDETPARVEMRKLLSLFPEVEVIGEAADVEAALELTARYQPHICFLDIQLAGESGFDYVARVGGNGPRIVFVTAYDRYAVRGFECNALDYLLKPVQPERLGQSLRRVPLSAPSPPSADDPVFLKGTSSARFAAWSEIGHVRAEGNYSRVCFLDGSDLLVLRPLKDWMALAPEGFFVQVHRSEIVQQRAVREVRVLAVNTRELTLSNGQKVPVGRAFWGRIKSGW